MKDLQHLQRDFAQDYIMFDYMEFQAFGPGEILDLYSTSSPACVLQDQDQDQDQDLAAYFPELIEPDWQQCRWTQRFSLEIFKE